MPRDLITPSISRVAELKAAIITQSPLYELSLVLSRSIRPQDVKNRASCPLSRTQQYAGQSIVGWPDSRANLHPLASTDWAFIGANDQFQL